MKVLLDNNVNQRFVRLLANHQVVHARDLGWSDLSNGRLIAIAEDHGFQVLVTADRQMRHQQNIRDRAISVLVLNSLFLTWDHLLPLAPKVQAILDGDLSPGSFVVVEP